MNNHSTVTIWLSGGNTSNSTYVGSNGRSLIEFAKADTGSAKGGSTRGYMGTNISEAAAVALQTAHTASAGVAYLGWGRDVFPMAESDESAQPGRGRGDRTG
jgi:hypothetical protein